MSKFRTLKTIQEPGTIEKRVAVETIVNPIGRGAHVSLPGEWLGETVVVILKKYYKGDSNAL